MEGGGGRLHKIHRMVRLIFFQLLVEEIPVF